MAEEDDRRKRKRWWDDESTDAQFEALQRMFEEIMKMFSDINPEDTYELSSELVGIEDFTKVSRISAAKRPGKKDPPAPRL